MSGSETGGLLGDAIADIDLSAPQTLAKSYLTYEQYDVTLRHPDGTVDQLSRDVIRVGRVAGVLCVDPARNVLVLIRQFRLSAHLATGRGELVEIVAGRVERGEDCAEAARRECLEEIGLEPYHLEPLFTFLPTPGVTDESCDLFLGLVDASRVPAQAGAAGEQEVTRPFTVSVDDALSLLEPGRSCNGYLLLALQWLALNRQRLPELMARGQAGAP